MAYYEVQSFNAGIDLRKAPINAPAGTLRKLENAVVGPGGEIEKRWAFTVFDTVPANTVGIAGDSIYGYTFGTKTAYPTDVPPTLTKIGVMGLAMPAGVTIARLLDVERFDNKFYVIVMGSDAKVYHFYAGALITLPATNQAIQARTHKSKMYRVDGPQVAFSAVGNPASISSGTGFGSINISAEDADMQEIIGIETYYDKLALMSRYATQLWVMDPDPAKNQFQQTLRQAGTIAPRSVRQYGSGDVLYLAADGARSLKARDQSLAAAVSDIGSPIDALIQGLVRSSGIDGYLDRAQSLLEPYSGRFWIVLPDRILVLSAFPTPRITAWSTFVTDFAIADAAVSGDTVLVRAPDNKVYAYATGSASYANNDVNVELPFLSFDKPATFKNFTGVDVSCEGTWELYVAFDPNNPTAEEYMGVVTGPTFPARRFALTGYATHCSLRLRNRIAGEKAILSSLVIHYELAEAE